MYNTSLSIVMIYMCSKGMWPVLPPSFFKKKSLCKFSDFYSSFPFALEGRGKWGRGKGERGLDNFFVVDDMMSRSMRFPREGIGNLKFGSQRQCAD